MVSNLVMNDLDLANMPNSQRTVLLSSLEESTRKTLMDGLPTGTNITNVTITKATDENGKVVYEIELSRRRRRLNQATTNFEYNSSVAVETTVLSTFRDGALFKVEVDGTQVEISNITVNGTNTTNDDVLATYASPTVVLQSTLQQTESCINAATAATNSTDNSTNTTTSAFLTLLRTTVAEEVAAANSTDNSTNTTTS